MSEQGEARAAPPRWALPLLVGLIVAFWSLGAVANGLAPRLLRDHPLLLVALEPRNRFLLLAAGKVDPVPFVAFATFRRIASDPVYFAVGYLYGDAATRWVRGRAGPRGARAIGRLEAVFPRFSRPLVFLFPGLLVCLLAGVTRMRPRTFLVWNLAGTVAAVLALRAFASVLEPWLDPVVEFNERYADTLTYLTVALVAGYLLWQRARGGGELAAVQDLREELADDDGPTTSS
ncbi:MAG: DedA family protein [Acidimicrobiia bacterium]